MWLRYVFGARLPDAHLGWVHTDLTGPGWARRQLGRVMLQLSPLLLIFMGLATIVAHLSVLERVLVVAILPVSALFTITMVSHQVRDRRLRQHELPVVSDDPWGEGPTYRY
jgi:ABC-type thiamine transport system ATPase subunit